MPDKKSTKKGKPSLNFDNISKNIANADHKQHIDQLSPALTDVFLKHAKIKDKKTGVITYKSKFSKEEAEKLANDMYDALAYHSHRRVFGMDEKSYDNLKKFKDANGNPYVDTVTRHHYSINRNSLKKQWSDDKENTITVKGLEKILEKPIEHHANLLTRGIIEKEGLDDPKHMAAVKGAIEKIVDKHKLSKKRFNTEKINDYDTLLQTYLALSQQHYSD